MVDAEQLKGLSAEQLHEVPLRLIDGFAEQQLPDANASSTTASMPRIATAKASAFVLRGEGSFLRISQSLKSK